MTDLPEPLGHEYGPQARNRLAAAADPGQAGALAALETFYFALNHADLTVLGEVWSEHPLAQLDNPVGGILRSGAAVVGLYRRIFDGSMDVRVTFTDAVAYRWPAGAVFTGREEGSYADGGGRVPLHIRTTRCFGWDAARGRWAQLHHHGSIDDPAALAAYQGAARG